MLFYLIQTSLMLLAAYFLGCWLGCLLHRMIGAREPVAVRAEPRPVTPATIAPIEPVAAAPQPRVQAIPVSPRPPAATEPVFRRTDRIVDDVPPAPPPAKPPVAATPPVMPPAPAATPSPVPATATAPVAPRPAPPMPAPGPAPAVSPAPVAVTEPPRPPVVTGVSVTAAAAAAAAAAIAQGRAREQFAGKPPPDALLPSPLPSSPTPPSAPVSERQLLPAAGAASGVSGVAVGGHARPTPAIVAAPAPVSAPVVPPQHADDLKRLRGVGPEIEAALHRIGVRRYAEIAGWSASDVDKISTTLGLKGRIEHENWIEQAQVLSKGGETAFSRRYDRGEMETVPAPMMSSPVAPVTVKPMPPSTLAPTTSSTTSSHAAISAAAVAAAAAAAQRAQSGAAVPVAPRPAVTNPVTANPVAPHPAPRPPSTPPATVDRVRELSGILAGTVKPVVAPAPVTAPAPVPAPAPSAVVPRPVVAPAPLQAPTPQSTPTPAVRVGDDLTRIRGIDGDLARLLNERGITKFAQIGTWTAADADRYGAALMLKLGRVQQESWIEQARLLAGMGPMPTPQAPRTDRAEGAGASGHQRQNTADWAPGADVAPTNPAPAAQTVAVPPAPAPAIDPSIAIPASTPPASATPTGGARVVRSGIPDDLKRIKGIGVVLEKKLHGLGIINYGQIAGWKQGEIDEMSERLEFKGRIERENWIEQARILATGGITDFARRVDRGEVETGKPRPVR